MCQVEVPTDRDPDAVPGLLSRWTVWNACAFVVLVLLAGPVSWALAARGATESAGFTLDLADMTYNRQGEAIVADIVAGDLESAESGLLRLRALDVPQPFVVALAHNAIGIAYGETGHFESAVAHLEESAAIDNHALRTLPYESRAYLVYAHAALGRFEEAERLRSPRTNWPWLFAKLAALYADLGYYGCAVANGEKALESGRAGFVLTPFYVGMSDVADRDAVLREWSDRLGAARQALQEGAAAGTVADDAPVVCVGRGPAAVPLAAGQDE